MAAAVRMGVVGAGSISVRGILPHLCQPDLADRVKLAAVCDPVPGRADAAAAKFGVEQGFTEYEDLLARGDVDAVTIASPIGLHYEQGKLALQAGKHVHFNKTMTVTVAEASELIDLAAANSLRIVASPGEMLRPHHVRTRELIASGAIGTLSWVSCGAAFGTYHEDESVRGGSDVLSNIDPSWYFRKPGGGPMYDMTVYSLHTVTGILGPARRVTAMSGVRVPVRSFGGRDVETDADDNTAVLIDFGANLFCVATGTAAGGMTGGMGGAFYGTKGTINGLLLNGEPFDFPGRNPDERSARGHGNQALLPHVTGVHRDIEEQHVYEDVMQLVDWVRDGSPSIVTAEHARHVIDIIESAYRAASTGQTQDLTTTF
ncbi:Gfo/Idh/MocA family protein [Tenggerimyces flavus]|uniref:Gfo/Idh/MocA family protein n=1 Tax=Tenggerimyces flavus TaxID=1708749 RepID=A0ABV7YN86_9ACTN|nr:Gfo/Idh/MocA family oxidoreductase [Tenggerimyces flavus]MBM7784855.1 putative dehydrogenase [Tenggerimyces flavus]